MEKAGVSKSTQQTFVVTAIFMTQRTVAAKSESEALELCEAGLVQEGAEPKDLCNWHAHEVKQ